MKNMKLKLITVLLILIMVLLAQEENVYPQPTDLVTLPTAGLIPRGAYMVDFRLFENGGILGGVSAGISNRFMFGIGFGGSKIIGDQEINWNKQPSVEVKYRFVDESVKFPAILAGFNSKGYGEYIDSLNRYETKAMGFYCVASKNFRFFGNLGIHAGANFNPLEKKDGDNDPSFFIGLDKDIGSEISLVLEYDAALNDNGTNTIGLGEGKGYLNCGVRWRMAKSFLFEIDFNNILLNREEVKYYNRELKIMFIEFF